MFENSRFDNEMELYEAVDSDVNFGGNSEFETTTIRTDTGVILEPGDIILSTTLGSPISEPIRTIERWQTGGDPLSSHSAVYIGNDLVVEAVHEYNLSLTDFLRKVISGVIIRPKQGVTIRRMDEKLKGDTYAFVLRYNGTWDRDGKTKQQLQKQIVQYLHKKSQYSEKKKFDLEGAIKSVFFKNYKGDGNKFYCSELLLSAYENANIILLSRPIESGTPQGFPSDLERSPDLKHIGFLKKSNEKEYSGEFELEYENESIPGTDIDFSDVPYLKDISPSQMTRLIRWGSNLNNIYTLAKQNKGKALETLLKKFPSLLKYEGPLVIIYFLYRLIKLEVSFIKLLMEHQNFDVQIASLRGICYAIVARKQKISDTPPEPPKTWDNKLVRAYYEGAGYIGTLYKQEKEITPFEGIEDIPKITAVNMLWALFGKLLFYDKFDHSRWNKFKDLYGSNGLTWPVENPVILTT